jgi:AAA domain-containing protein
MPTIDSARRQPRLVEAQWPRYSKAAMHPTNITLFKDAQAKIKIERELTLSNIGCRIQMTHAEKKADLPWLKPARFGDARTDKGSLRHNANVKSLYGIAGDYDGEQMDFDEACEIVKKANVLALLYTSPSHREDAPRWRVIFLFSTELDPAQHHRMMARGNGILGGILSAESFTLSQSYYYGSCGNNPPPRVEMIAGDFIDLRDDLDATAVGKRAKAPADNYGSGNNVVDFPLGPRPPWVERLVGATSRLADAAQANMPGDGRHWFDRLSPERMGACICAIAGHPEFIKRAEGDYLQFRDDVWAFADAARLGAVGAFESCDTWRKTSAMPYKRDPDAELQKIWGDFDATRSKSVTVARLIRIASELEIDLSEFRDEVDAPANAEAGEQVDTRQSTTGVEAAPSGNRLRLGGKNATFDRMRRPRSPLTVTAAQPGAAKTGLGIHIAVALAAGHTTVGPYPVKGSELRVLYVSAEENCDELNLLIGAAGSVLSLSSAEEAQVEKNLFTVDAAEVGW